MKTPRGKSNKEKLSELVKKFDIKSSEYQNMNKSTKTAEKALISLEKINEEIKNLKLVQDVPFLSDTAKSKLAEIYTAVTKNRVKDIRSKYLEKGLLVEEDSITLYSRYTQEMFKKNTERKYNDFIEGEIDFKNTLKGVDVKSCWDCFTFDAKSAKVLDPIYDWQLTGYEWLWNLEKFELAYTLINTPKHLVEFEEKILARDFVGSKEDWQDALADLHRKHNYDDLDLEDRITIFHHQRSEEKIEMLKTQIPIWRDYLNNFKNPKYVSEDQVEY